MRELLNLKHLYPILITGFNYVTTFVINIRMNHPDKFGIADAKQVQELTGDDVKIEEGQVELYVQNYCMMMEGRDFYRNQFIQLHPYSVLQIRPNTENYIRPSMIASQTNTNALQVDHLEYQWVPHQNWVLSSIRPNESQHNHNQNYLVYPIIMKRENTYKLLEHNIQQKVEENQILEIKEQFKEEKASSFIRFQKTNCLRKKLLYLDNIQKLAPELKPMFGATDVSNRQNKMKHLKTLKLRKVSILQKKKQIKKDYFSTSEGRKNITKNLGLQLRKYFMMLSVFPKIAKNQTIQRFINREGSKQPTYGFNNFKQLCQDEFSKAVAYRYFDGSEPIINAIRSNKLSDLGWSLRQISFFRSMFRI